MTTRLTGGGPARLLLLAGCVLTSAGGCTSLSGVPPAPAAGTQFDGVYGGQDTLISGVDFQCGAPSHSQTIAVIGGRFEYPFEVNPPRTAPLIVQVAADGSFSGQMQYGVDEDLMFRRQQFRTAWATVTGRIAGPVLDATIDGYRCVRRLTAQRG
jgi:hypothetical protein